MTKLMFGLSFGFTALIFATQNAFAANSCAERAIVLQELDATYHETRRAVGIAGTRVVMEMFASSTTGTWTLIATNADGVTCLVTSGTGFELVTEDLTPSGDPA